MSMSLNEALRKGWLGKGTVEQVYKTLPGRLAVLIDQILYDINEQPKPTNPHAIQRLDLPAKVFVHHGKDDVLKKPHPSYPGLDEEGNYADVRRALREVHDFLLACAVREVSDR